MMAHAQPTRRRLCAAHGMSGVGNKRIGVDRRCWRGQFTQLRRVGDFAAGRKVVSKLHLRISGSAIESDQFLNRIIRLAIGRIEADLQIVDGFPNRLHGSGIAYASRIDLQKLISVSLAEIDQTLAMQRKGAYGDQPRKPR